MEMGSQRYMQFSSGAQPFGVLIGMARNPQINNNFFFSNTDFVSAIPRTEFPNGVGERYLAASAMNIGSNFTMAAAKTDPRHPGFIMNSMDQMLSDPNFEMEIGQGITASRLSVEQAGENAARYLAPEVITPEVGYYQTADNQQSFESAYDNVMLGRAEEALFEGDQMAATAFFDSKVQEYQNSSDKQTSAGSFQKEGMLRSVKTAETFRDFFQMKAEMTNQNLSQMPTTESLVQNCHSNSPSGENLHGVYQRAMPQEDISFYGMTPPVYNFDFCDSYVHSEGNFLIQNRPVRTQLKSIVDDSTEMANGLDQIIQELQGRDIRVEDIAEILNNNEAWKKLAGRAKGYKECKEKNCFEAAEKTFGKMVDYPGASRHRPQYRKEFHALLKSIRENKSMPGASSGLLASLRENLAKAKEKDGQTLGGKLANGLSSVSEDELKNSKDSIRSPASQGSRAVYTGKKFPRGGGYYRGEDGVLRGPSGRPVQGYAGQPDTSIWEIISRRYMIKMKDEL